jgi:hypothetical protein
MPAISRSNETVGDWTTAEVTVTVHTVRPVEASAQTLDVPAALGIDADTGRPVAFAFDQATEEFVRQSGSKVDPELVARASTTGAHF